MNCPRCYGLMLQDSDGEPRCINCGRTLRPLIPGATLPRNRPPTGHQGIDFNRHKPIATREPQKRRTDA